MTAVQSVSVQYKRDIPAMSGRRLRALLHKAWINGNESYELHESPEGLINRNDFIADLLIKEGLAEPKVKK